MSDDSTRRGRPSCPCAVLGLRGSHMQASASLDDLGGLLETLEHLEHHGKVRRWRGKDVLAVVVEDKVGVEFAGPDQ